LITSRYNGASEMFCDGQDVLLVDDPADDAELAAALQIVLDEAARRRLGAAARTTILPHSFQQNVEHILHIYQEILDRRCGLPHGYQVLESRIRGSDLPSGKRLGRRLLEIIGVGVKK
jgi:hypothetical protein